MSNDRRLTILDRCLLAVGITCIGIYAGVLVYRSLASRAALRDFDRVRAAAREPAVRLEEPQQGDFHLWSAKRVRTYQASRAVEKGPLLAILTVPKLNLRVPVFEGTDEWSLNRGVGWIAGTARPGANGNIGVAGHRDGFFRGLKNVSVGDSIGLLTITGEAAYTVDNIEIVTPDNVGVLGPRGAPSLTLVTCYPFYFVGDAPQRFIVHATVNQAGGR